MHLTYPNSDIASSSDRPTLPVGAEVTPEMIEAGVRVLVSADRRIEGESEIVESIFTAMFSASPAHHPASRPAS
jgi:hypothetical protein